MNFFVKIDSLTLDPDPNWAPDPNWTPDPNWAQNPGSGSKFNVFGSTTLHPTLRITTAFQQ